MTAITWNLPGEKIYETGIDKAVLYVPGLSPKNWNGILSITNSPTGGESEASFYEGNKHLDKVSKQEYKSTIDCFYTPEEFNSCNGYVNMYQGLIATNQKRSKFNLSYRTTIGNDLSGINMGYKIHLIYNAVATSSGSDYKTRSNTEDPVIYTWTITATPPQFSNTAYRVIDSRKYSEQIMLDVENALYGTDSSEPYFPSIEQLSTLLQKPTSSSSSSGGF